MFGDPVKVDKDNAVFFLVWTYGVKTLDGRKKAHCVCDGSSRSGTVKVLDETYANCVNQTSSHLFYAISAAITTYGDHYKDIDSFMPESFTTPITARAARIFAPNIDYIQGNPWLAVL